MKYFVPTINCYYHFITESIAGLFYALKKSGQLQDRDCYLWYRGKYASIMQMFSRHPIQIIKFMDEVPEDALILTYARPRVHKDWLSLKPMRDYMMDMFPLNTQAFGITVIKRVHNRVYVDHDELIQALPKFGLPVREAIMELLPIGEQINLMRNTSVLVGPHGSGETNMIFMPPGSKIIELYPKGFSDQVFVGLARAFGHTLVEIESDIPSALGRVPTERVSEYLKLNGWPTRQDFKKWAPDKMEMGRVLRDVSTFSINPAIVTKAIEKLQLPG